MKTVPLHRYLDKTFRADKATVAMQKEMCFDADGDKVAKLQKKVCEINFAFFSGHYGRCCVEDFSNMILNLQANSWPRTLPHQDRLRIASDMVVCMLRAWQRLVFFWDDPRFAIMKASSPDGGANFYYDREHVESVLRDLKESCLCNKCFDKAFAAEQVRLLEKDLAKGYNNVKGVLTFSRVGIGSVERVHLMRADLKPNGSRGLAVDARRLGEMTYV